MLIVSRPNVSRFGGAFLRVIAPADSTVGNSASNLIGLDIKTQTYRSCDERVPFEKLAGCDVSLQ